MFLDFGQKFLAQVDRNSVDEVEGIEVILSANTVE